MRRVRFSAATAALTLALTGCGKAADVTGSQPAPPASEFPAAAGRPLPNVLSAASSQGPVVAPTVGVLRKGSNRFGFGVFTVAHKEIAGAQVALYTAHGPNGRTIGPFPARMESLQTDPKYEAKTTAGDPDAAKVVYITQIPFNGDGEWRLGALIKKGDNYEGALLPSVVVGASPAVPAAGDKAPLIHTPTAADVGGDLSKIDTRQPHDDMHETDFHDVVGKKPVVLLFATPALCQTRVCGPVVDVAEQVKNTAGGDAAFIHMEVYKDNDVNKGIRPQLRAFHLASEPWAFVIDRHGRISSELQGAFSVDELEQAVKKVTG